MMRRWETFAVSAVVISWVMIKPLQWYWPSIEGHFFPVVGTVTLSDPQPYPPPGYRYTWKGEAEKARDCAFKRVEWFMGIRGEHFVQVPAEFLDPPEVRTVGVLSWDEIAISLDPDNVRGNSYAYVYHDCGWPWEVRSLFHDAALIQQR